MSSSTMMNGATIPRPYHQRKRLDATTMPTSHAHAGTRRRLSTKLDLREAARELLGLGRVGLDPDVGGGARHLAEDGVRDRVASGRLLERSRVELGNAVEVVLPPGELCGGRTHRLP